MADNRTNVTAGIGTVSSHTVPAISCEFFPPSDDQAADRLRRVTRRLREELQPSYCSVTYGAGGSTRNRTFATVFELHHAGVPVAPHLTCIASTHKNLAAIVRLYRDQGIRHIVALRGDLPSGMRIPGELRHADELVRLIRDAAGDGFHIDVACYPEIHPQAATADADLAHFQRKVAAGADSAITQYFYNADAYFRFRDDCYRRGIDIPLIPGIMPIINYRQLARFSERCGAEIPRWLRLRLQACGDNKAALRRLGLEAVTGLCQRLLAGGAPGLHFYTMNLAEPSLAICRELGLTKAKAA